MLKLDKTLQAWVTSDFEVVFKQEVAELGTEQLPLQQGLATSSMVTADHITVLVQHITEMDDVIRIKAGILYTGIIAGCSCVDDPSRDNTNNEYCVVQLDIDKATAITAVSLVDVAD